jgi:hypothetical protein
MTAPDTPPPADAVMTTPEQAQTLARELLVGEGTRLQHVRTAGLVAARLSVLFDPEDAQLLITAATLHDIGYSARIAHTGFHPLDGGAFLRAQGYPERLACLVAHHSLAMMTAPAHGIRDLSERFPREDGLLADALAYADMHSAPDGRLIPAERRLADIARRHPDRADADRAQHLRAAIARVGAALLAAGRVCSSGEPPAPIRAAATRHLDRAATSRPGAEDVGSGYRSIVRSGQRRPPASAPVPDPVRSAFHAWWAAESQYSLALDLYPAEDCTGPEVREAALRLARLRSRADSRRDMYFRAALT